MAKDKKGESSKPSRPKRHQVVLDPDLARMIGVIAAALDMSVPDWVNNRLRPIAQVELQVALKEMGLGDTPKK